MTDQMEDKNESMDQVPDEPTPAGDDAAATGGGEPESGTEAGAAHAESSEVSETETAAASANAESGAPEDATPEGGVTPAGAADAEENTEAAWATALAETEGADTQSGVAETAITQTEPTPAAHPADFPEFGSGYQGATPGNMDLLMDVKLPVSIELGRTTLEISDILKWGTGSIVELDKLAGEPVNLLVNNKMVAKGEVVVVDENFGLRITSLIAEKEHEDAR